MQDEDQQAQPSLQPNAGAGKSLEHAKVIQPISSGLTVPTPRVAPSASDSPSQDTANLFQPPSPVPNAAPPTDPYVGLTGSQIQAEKNPLPIGIYILAGVSFLAFVAGFIATQRNSTLYTLLMFINLLLAIGLVLRLELARKVILWTSVISFVFLIASIFLLIGLQNKLATSKSNYDAAISRINLADASPTQQQAIQKISDTLNTQEKQVGKLIAFDYVKLGLAAVEQVVIIVYVTRPKVKEAFHELEK